MKKFLSMRIRRYAGSAAANAVSMHPVKQPQRIGEPLTLRLWNSSFHVYLQQLISGDYGNTFSRMEGICILSRQSITIKLVIWALVSFGTQIVGVS